MSTHAPDDQYGSVRERPSRLLACLVCNLRTVYSMWHIIRALTLGLTMVITLKAHCACQTQRNTSDDARSAYPQKTKDSARVRVAAPPRAAPSSALTTGTAVARGATPRAGAGEPPRGARTLSRIRTRTLSPPAPSRRVGAPWGPHATSTRYAVWDEGHGEGRVRRGDGAATLFSQQMHLPSLLSVPRRALLVTSHAETHAG